MDSERLIYTFTRRRVERADFGHFLGVYALDKLPCGPPLGKLMNSFIFCIEGWANDPRPMHLVPEIRRFYSAFHQAWPYWLYFCSLGDDTLWTMTMCCLPELNTWQVDGEATVGVTGDPIQLLTFITKDLTPFNEICDRADFAAEQVFHRTRAVFQYFGLSPDGKSA